MKHVVAAFAVLGSFLGIAQTGYWCEWLCVVVGTFWTQRRRAAKLPARGPVERRPPAPYKTPQRQQENTMANGVNELAVKRPATTLASGRQRVTDCVPRTLDHHDGLPRLLVLIPVGSLVLAGLLIIALSRLAGAPVLAPSHSFLGADAENQMDGLGIAESEVR